MLCTTGPLIAFTSPSDASHFSLSHDECTSEGFEFRKAHSSSLLLIAIALEKQNSTSGIYSSVLNHWSFVGRIATNSQLLLNLLGPNNQAYALSKLRGVIIRRKLKSVFTYLYHLLTYAVLGVVHVIYSVPSDSVYRKIRLIL